VGNILYIGNKLLQTENNIAESGGRTISEALKVNSTLTSLDLESEDRHYYYNNYFL